MKAFRSFAIGVLLACGASSEAAPYYAGWTVGSIWDGYGTILRSTDSGNTWTRQGAGQIANVNVGGVFAVDPYTAWVVGDSDGGYATIYHTTDGGSTWAKLDQLGGADLPGLQNISFAIQPIPEPSTLTLCLGLFGTGATRLRLRRRK